MLFLMPPPVCYPTPSHMTNRPVVTTSRRMDRRLINHKLSRGRCRKPSPNEYVWGVVWGASWATHRRACRLVRARGTNLVW